MKIFVVFGNNAPQAAFFTKKDADKYTKKNETGGYEAHGIIEMTVQTKGTISPRGSIVDFQNVDEYLEQKDKDR